jgi:hypothetical protein
MAKKTVTPGKKWNTAKAVAVMAATLFGVSATFLGCDNGTATPSPKTFTVNLGGKQIQVEDMTGTADQSAIQSVLNSLNSTFPGSNDIIYFKSMSTTPVMVIENTHNFRVEGNKFFIGADKLDINGIWAAIANIYNLPNSPLMSKLLIEFGKPQWCLVPNLDHQKGAWHCYGAGNRLI